MNLRKKVTIISGLFTSGRILEYSALITKVKMLQILGRTEFTHSLNLTPIVFPVDHQLPSYRCLYPSYSENLGRLMGSVCKFYRLPQFVDIGANIGDSYAICSAYGQFKYLAVEGDPFFYKFLKNNLKRFSYVSLEQSFLGEDNKKLALSSNRLGGTGWLSGDKSANSNKITTKPLNDVLKTHRFDHPVLIKSDTDGFDFRILTPYLRTVKSLPILFLEYDPDKFDIPETQVHKFTALLSRKGYSIIHIFNNYGEFVRTVEKKSFHDIYTLYAEHRKSGICEYFDLAVFPSAYKKVSDDYLNNL